MKIIVINDSAPKPERPPTLQGIMSNYHRNIDRELGVKSWCRMKSGGRD